MSFLNKNERFNSWILLEDCAGSKKHALCLCVCGKKKKVLGQSLKYGISKSCGCIYKIKHGMYGTRVYHIWEGMIQRTTNPNAKSWKYYGGRGITVCDEWKDFANF